MVAVLLLAPKPVVARSLEVKEEVAQSWGVMAEVVHECCLEGAGEPLSGEALLRMDLMRVVQS